MFTYFYFVILSLDGNGDCTSKFFTVFLLLYKCDFFFLFAKYIFQKGLTPVIYKELIIPKNDNPV